jgi:predicted heme/steroid binding protein
MGEMMKKTLIILVILFGAFLAIGCAGTTNESQAPAGTPAEAASTEQAGTPVETITETANETPVVETTPASAGTPTAEKTTEGQAISGSQNASGTQGMKEYTLEELAQYNGQSGKTYVAYQGKVYDISASSGLWQNGMHHGHNAGQDFTDQMDQAPHGAVILKSYPVVGTLKQQ